MKNKFLFVLALLLAACGGEATGEYSDYSADAGLDSGLELGQAEEKIVTQINNPNDAFSYVTGVMYEDNPLAGLTYQWSPGGVDSYTIFVPYNRALTFKTAQGPCTSTQFTAMRTQLDSLLTQLTNVYGGFGWSFSRSEANGLHTVQCLNLNTSPLGTNNIRNFSRTQCNIDGTRVISSVDSRVNGNLVNFTSCFVQIDVPDVYARGANATEDGYLLWHAVAHGVMKIMGIGAIPGNTLNVAANETITPIGSTRTLVTTGASCRTKNYAPGGAGQWAIFNLSNSAHCDNN